MKYSPAFRRFIFLLLPLTIALKLTVTPDGALNLRDMEEVQEKLVEFLNRNQFDVDIEKLLDAPVIRASTGTCQMLIMNVSLDGWQRDLIRGRARTTDRVLYIFRGKVYAHQPVWLTATVGIWSRQLQRLGLLRNVPPVIAIIAPRLCDAEHLPWTELDLTANNNSTDLAAR